MRLTDGSWICTTCRVLCSLKGYEARSLGINAGDLQQLQRAH